MSLAVLILAWLRLTAASYYFHEPSRVIIKPNPTKDHQTFGFSLGYQSGTASLVAGAPHSGLVGEVFQCPLDNIFINQTYCENIHVDFDTLAPYNREYTPSIKLNLGASVAAAPHYFLTCAPLWTTIPDGGMMKNLSYGTCFTYNGTVQRYSGLIEQHQSKPGTVTPYSILYGGTGWKTLLDETNEMLLIAKVSLVGDIVYVNSSNPLEDVTSLVAKSSDSGTDKYRTYFQNYRHLGYSMTTGKFFDSQTMYAVSAMFSATTEGTVHFFYAKISKHRKNFKKLKLLNIPVLTKEGKEKTREKEKKTYVKITDDSSGSMFGAAMASADINNDGLSELLVGAPAQGDEDRGSETGAVHIYLGGDMICPEFQRTINEASRHRVIVSSEDGSRFGSTLATSDVDGDNYPEIFVSAPYEDKSVGALYILSGSEVNEVVFGNRRIKRIALAKLKKTQKIISKEFKTFGYSLQSIPDMNDNGCDELAIGAPGSNKIILLRCIPAVNVTISTSLVGAQIVKEQDNNFTVSVCISVKHLKGRNFTIELKATNEIIGNRALIEAHQRSFPLVVSSGEREEIKCSNVIVKLDDNEAGEYRFSTKVEMDKEKVIKSDKFDMSWVMISSQSLTETSFEVSRHCTDKDCDPDLTVSISWTGSNDTFELGSSDSLLVTLKIENRGNSSFEACMLVRVSGAPVLRINCGDHFDGYKCYMPKPLRRNAVHELPIMFNMSQSSSHQRELRIEISLYELCNQPNVSKEFKWTLLYKLNPDLVVLKSLGHNQTVTDVEIEDVKVNTINDAHEYWVVNNGSVTWKNVTILISTDKKPFIESYRVSWQECLTQVRSDKYLFVCVFDLEPLSTVKIIVTSVILKSKIMENLQEGKLEFTSILSLKLSSATSVKEKQTKLSSVITWQKEKTLGQKKQLIFFLAILGALIALAIFIFILYKMEFFKRKDKTMLEAMKKELVRRQSVKRSMSVATHSEEGGLDMEVDDDCPFEIVDITDPILGDDSNVRDTKL